MCKSFVFDNVKTITINVQIIFLTMVMVRVTYYNESSSFHLVKIKNYTMFLALKSQYLLAYTIYLYEKLYDKKKRKKGKINFF